MIPAIDGVASIAGIAFVFGPERFELDAGLGVADLVADDLVGNCLDALAGWREPVPELDVGIAQLDQRAVAGVSVGDIVIVSAP